MNGSAPIVSVVIPTFQRAEMLCGTLAHVFAQKFTDYEVIVVDDGSTDATGGAMKPLEESGKIRYLRQENQGPGASRNLALAQARGRYIAFLDDDDIWPVDKLEWQVEMMEEQPSASLVYGSMSMFTGTPDENLSLYPGIDAPSGMVHGEFLRRNWIHSPGQTLIRKSALEESGGFDTELHGTEDYDLYIRLAKLGPFIYRPKRALFYRSHAARMSGNIRSMYIQNGLVRNKHLGRWPGPKNWGLWFANDGFRRSVAGSQFVHASLQCIESGDKKTARRMYLHALSVRPTLIRKTEMFRILQKLW